MRGEDKRRRVVPKGRKPRKASDRARALQRCEFGCLADGEKRWSATDRGSTVFGYPTQLLGPNR